MKYKTVYADPPWNERGAGKCVRGAQKHYELMHTNEIIEYMKNIQFDDNCHLWLWVTNNHLIEGLEVMKALGFTYKTNVVWVKKKSIDSEGDKIGLGQYLRGMHELCIFGVRGHVPYKDSTEANRSCCTELSCIIAPRREHSQKPDEMYSKIEKISYSPFLEVFARQRRQGWDAMGNEVPDETQGKLPITA